MHHALKTGCCITVPTVGRLQPCSWWTDSWVLQ